MKFTQLGSTGLRVSVAGLGCGGFSALGMSSGKTEEEAADVVRTALDLGVNYIDTAAVYGTEGAVGRAIAGRRRDEIVIATKGRVADRTGRLVSSAEVAEGIDGSLKALGTDFIDVYQPHGPRRGRLEHLLEVVLPVLVRAKQAGKIRHIGLSESGDDPQHEILAGAADAAAFEVMLVAFHMMHQSAAHGLFERLRRDGVGVVVMYAVRNMFARQARLAEVFAELAADGRLPQAMARQPEPLGFLLHPAGAASLTEAAYRFARHEPGVDVVLFGTGNPDHVRANVAAILKPPLPAEDVRRIRGLFGHLAGVGLDTKPGRQAHAPASAGP
jgi:L-galactose dehydrogenase